MPGRAAQETGELRHRAKATGIQLKSFCSWWSRFGSIWVAQPLIKALTRPC